MTTEWEQVPGHLPGIMWPKGGPPLRFTRSTEFYVHPQNSAGDLWGAPLRFQVDEDTGIVRCPQLVGEKPTWPK